MSLLAEAYTVGEDDEMLNEALKIYNQLAELKASKPTQQAEIYKKMAPLYAQQSDFSSAVSCQRKCLELELDETSKI